MIRKTSTHLSLTVALGIAVFAAMTTVSSTAVQAQERVQLASFPVRIFTISGANAGMKPVTLFMDVRNKEHADYVCALAPRVRSAILAELNRAPVYLGPDGSMPLHDMEVRLKPVIEFALKVQILTGIDVVDGVRKMAVGTAAKLPSAQTGCIRVSAK